MAARRRHELGVEGLPAELRERLGDELIDQLLAGAKTQEEIVGPGGVLAQLTKRLVERAMDAELSEHLGYERGGAPPGGAGNARNGTTPKTLRTDHGPVRVETPRDRQGSFEPRILPKRTTRFAGFDDKIIALYARGMSVRDIQAHLAEIYGVEVGRDLISRVTDAVTRGCPRLAAAAARGRLPGRVPRLPGDQGPRSRQRAAPGLLPRVGRDPRWRPGRARDVVPGDRGREVLAPGPQRPQAARRPGHPDRAASTGSRGSPKRSRRSSPRPGCRPASST